MAFVALTRRNIDFIGRELKKRYAPVRSSHVAEAVAAACGFRTNIAMIASLRERGTMLPALVVMDGTRFLGRLADFGYTTTLDEEVWHDLARAQELPERIWSVCKDNDLPRLNRWYAETRRRGIPCINIKTRRTLADVDWDCIGLDPKYDPVMNDRSSSGLIDRLFRRFQETVKGKPGKPLFYGSSFAGFVENVPIGVAPDVADALFGVLHEALIDARHTIA